MVTTFSAPSVEQLETEYKVALAKINDVRTSTARAATQLSALGLGVGNLNRDTERLVGISEKVSA